MNRKIHIGETPEGKFLVASTEQPIFCFEKDTLEEAKDIALRAFNAYASRAGDTTNAPVVENWAFAKGVFTKSEELAVA